MKSTIDPVEDVTDRDGLTRRMDHDGEELCCYDKNEESPYLYPNLKRRRLPTDRTEGGFSTARAVGVLSILVKVLLGVGPAEAPPQEKSLE